MNVPIEQSSLYTVYCVLLITTAKNFMTYNITPVAIAHSPYGEKFATPRQPGLVASAQGKIELLAPFNQADAVKGLELCSHIWLEFVFHQCIDQGWKSKVRPPRLGGNQKIGVFATRSTHRPNGLGLSVVKLDKIEASDNGVVLWVSGLDLIDGTPVIDIKPYIPYSDALPDAQYSIAQDAPPHVPVFFSDKSTQQLTGKPQLRQFIEETLSQDPKPAFHKIDPERVYGALLMDHNVTWRYTYNTDNQVQIEVLSL